MNREFIMVLIGITFYIMASIFIAYVGMELGIEIMPILVMGFVALSIGIGIFIGFYMLKFCSLE